MLEILYKYFIQQKSLYLPGIGLFLMKQQSPWYNAADQRFHSQGWKAVLTDEQTVTHKELFSYIANEKGVTELEAIQLFNACIFEIRQTIKSGKAFYWKGVGVLKAGLTSAQTILEPDAHELSYLKPVAARRVVRTDAVHTVLVGDEEMTNIEVSERQKNTPALSRRRWWIYAIIAAVTALILLFFHFYTTARGQNPFGNRSVLQFQQP